MDPKILFEDHCLIVLDKPAGMIVYPDQSHDYPALSSWLELRYSEYHFVHRIDRETSGVLVVAKDVATHEFLKKQFQEREIQKTYRAFVYGATEERGVIDKPIGSTRGGLGPRSAKKPYGVLREATTIYRTITATPDASYVEVFPKTGRTHQIRVHFSAIQHPIVGDSLYAPGRPALLGFERLALHALSITFEHPSGEKMSFEAPLPEDFVQAEQSLTK